MTNPENHSSIFGVNVSSMSTSNGGMSANQPAQIIGEAEFDYAEAQVDSAFEQVMQLMFSFCRNSTCNLQILS